jgi:hypothetical protein
MNTMNAVYKLAETTIKDSYTVEDNDEVMAFLQNSVIDEDEFLRFRISERFNVIIPYVSYMGFAGENAAFPR